MNFFDEFLHGFGIGTNIGGTEQRQQSQNGAPPASSRILQSLPTVSVTADDLADEANRECAVCLEAQEIGGTACKLQCGHLYHLDCLKEWLVKHCTCPICRFELQTDDEAYERERKKRMMNRRLRYRADELRSKKISQLQELCRSLSVSTANCFDKQDLIDRLIVSGRIDITEGAPQLELTYDELNGKTIRELQELLRSYGISSQSAVEKRDLRQLLMDSGRVNIVSKSPSTSGSAVSGGSTSSVTVNTEDIVCIPIHFSHNHWLALNINELQKLHRELGMPYDHCVDKRDLQDNLIKLGFIVIDSNGSNEKIANGATDGAAKDKIEDVDMSVDDDYVIVDDKSQRTASDTIGTKSSVAPVDQGAVRVAVDQSINASSSSSFATTTSAVSTAALSTAASFLATACSASTGFVGEASSWAASSAFSSSAGDGSSNRSNTTSSHYSSNVRNDIRHDQHGVQSNRSSPQTSFIRSHSTTNGSIDPDAFAIDLNAVNAMSVKELKSIMTAYNIRVDGCLEKSDMIEALKRSGKVVVVNE